MALAAHRVLCFAAFLCLAPLCVHAAWTVPSAQLPRGMRRPAQAAVVHVRLQAAEKQIDDLIAKLRASEPAQLPKVLAENLKIIDQRLFLRLAEMSDAEDDDFEKLRIRQLATLVTNTIETILEQTDAQMDADAQVVQELLGTMASEAGEFELPIPPARIAALRETIRDRGGALDEGFVATVKAYMKKASDDGLDGMVDVMRVLLQAYAAERLRFLAGAQAAEAGTDAAAAEAAVMTLFEVSPTEWEGVLRGQTATCGVSMVVDMLQDKMGEVVLGMPAGSAVQTVLAEYLNELMSLARNIAAEDV